MEIGFAEVNITPPLGMQIPGYGPKSRLSTGVKNELFAKAMAVHTEGTTLIFVVLDIVSLDLEPVQRIRQRISQFTGVPELHVMISCTHTHTGPPRPEGDTNSTYYPLLEAKSADAGILAYAGRVQAKAGFGQGHEDSVAFNRRFFMKDGTVQTNPGILNPEIDRPEGPIDPEVFVMRVDNEQGETIGIVSNYACHTDTVSGTEYSGDFPAYISRTIKQLYGEHVVSLFFQGASANINHHDVSGRINPRIVPHPQRIGDILGLEISKVRNKIKAELSEARLAVLSKSVDVSERILSEEELAWSRSKLTELRDIPEDQLTSRQLMEKARAERRLTSASLPIPSRPIEIQVADRKSVV